MSNGLVNYKRIYTKTVGDQVINVQEGYNSVPIPGPRNQIQTQYYIADERGYNVYRSENSLSSWPSSVGTETHNLFYFLPS